MTTYAEKKKNLMKTINGINKRFGANSVMLASDAAKQGLLTKRRIKTPSLEINDMLSGGFTGIVELYGPTGSGKTSLAIETIAHNQKEDPEFIAAWLETEGSVTEEILQKHGVDMERLVYWRQEDVGNAESALDISRAIIAGGDIDMMVINSVAGLAPKTETEDDLDKQNIALVARLLSKYFRVITGQASKNNVTILFINQVRDNVGAMYGGPTTTGGKALGFYASQRVFMNQNKLEASDPIKKEEGMKIGCISKKNRFCLNGDPFTKCVYYVTYVNGIDSIVPIPAMLISKGIIKQSGSWLSYEENGKIASVEGVMCKWQGKNNFIDALRTNEAFKTFFVGKLDNLSVRQTDEEIAETEREEKELAKEFEEIEKQEEAADIDRVLQENE